MQYRESENLLWPLDPKLTRRRKFENAKFLGKYYYHHVLEAKLVLGDGLVISIGTEFIENEDENVSKNKTWKATRLVVELFHNFHFDTDPEDIYPVS